MAKGKDVKIVEGRNKGEKAREEGKVGQRSSKYSAYAMFTEEYFKNKNKQKGKAKGSGKGKGKGDGEEVGKSFKEANVDVREAWNKLTIEEKEEYRKRAEEARGPSTGKKYKVPFLTRCGPKQFMSVSEFIKKDPTLMARLKAIGFDRLVDICCTQINRDLCAEFMYRFDPPTNIVSIRGESRALAPSHVAEILGVPHGGEKIEANVEEKDRLFQDLRVAYRGVAYQKIGQLLMGESDENFEFLFVLYAVGTLLCPSSSICVTDRVLKVMRVTWGAFDKFDWSSFIVNELCESIAEFKKDSARGISKGRKTVGGCLYFLMIFCLQSFPLGKLVEAANVSAVEFWNEERVKRRVALEKESKRGLLNRVKRVGVEGQGAFTSEAQLTHPEIRRTYARIMGMVGEELLALQNRLEKEEEAGHSGVQEEPTEGSDDEEEGGKELPTTSGTIDIPDESAGAGDAAQSDSGASSQGGDGKAGDTGDSQPDDKDGVTLRRSQRAITPSWVVKSPWIHGRHKGKGKRVQDEQELLYEMCTNRSTHTNDGGDE